MSYQAMGWATEQDIPAMQKIVLLMLANRMNQDTGRCFPSHNRLATECGMSKRSVIRQIEKLEEFGFLSVIRETKNGAKIRNQYVLHLEMNNPIVFKKNTQYDRESLALQNKESENTDSDKKSSPKTSKPQKGSDRESLPLQNKESENTDSDKKSSPKTSKPQKGSDRESLPLQNKESENTDSDKKSSPKTSKPQKGSDRESLEVVTESHHPSDRESLEVVTESHINQSLEPIIKPIIINQKNSDKKSLLLMTESHSTKMMIDDFLKRIFEKEESQQAQKMLSEIIEEKQLQVLEVLHSKSKVVNKLGYMRKIILSVKNETFIPQPKPKKKPRIKKIWEKQGFNSENEYNQFMYDEQMKKYSAKKSAIEV